MKAVIITTSNASWDLALVDLPHESCVLSHLLHGRFFPTTQLTFFVRHNTSYSLSPLQYIVSSWVSPHLIVSPTVSGSIPILIRGSIDHRGCSTFGYSTSSAGGGMLESQFFHLLPNPWILCCSIISISTLCCCRMMPLMSRHNSLCVPPIYPPT